MKTKALVHTALIGLPPASGLQVEAALSATNEEVDEVTMPP
jgi:hypothetical protein